MTETSSVAGKGTRHEVVIENVGQSEARKVKIEFLNDDSPIPDGEAKRKLPVPVIPPGGRIELLAATSFDCAPPFQVVINWEDASGKRRQEATLT